MLKEKKEEVRVYSSKSDSRDEVDLGAFFNLLGRGFKRIGKFFKYLVRLFFRRILVVSFFVAVGLGIGFILYKKARPFYTSSMIVTLAEIRNDFVGAQLAILQQMVDDGNFPALAKRLEISPSEAQQIKSLRFANLDEDIVEEDSVLTGSPIRIELKLYDNTLFSTMEPAITSFLENNQFFVRKRQIRENRYRKLIDRFKNEIESIDSVKTSIIKPRGPVNGFVYGEPLDPTELYREGVTIYRYQVEMEGELKQMENIYVVNSFAPKLVPNGPDLILYLVLGGTVFLILGLICAHQLETRHRAGF